MSYQHYNEVKQKPKILVKKLIELQNDPRKLEEQKNKQKSEVIIGKWPVTVGAKFHGATIVGADYTHKTITLDWK